MAKIALEPHAGWYKGRGITPNLELLASIQDSSQAISWCTKAMFVQVRIKPIEGAL